MPEGEIIHGECGQYESECRCFDTPIRFICDEEGCYCPKCGRDVFHCGCITLDDSGCVPD